MVYMYYYNFILYFIPAPLVKLKMILKNIGLKGAAGYVPVH